MHRRSFLKVLSVLAGAASVGILRRPRDTSRVSYRVGKNEEFPAIQDALDQLWKDQRSVPFAARKTIWISEGVYAGASIPDGLRPSEEHPLAVQGVGAGRSVIRVPQGEFGITFEGSADTLRFASLAFDLEELRWLRCPSS